MFIKGYVGLRFLLTLKMGHKRKKVENHWCRAHADRWNLRTVRTRQPSRCIDVIVLLSWLNWTVNYSVQAAEDEGEWQTGGLCSDWPVVESCAGRVNPRGLRAPAFPNKWSTGTEGVKWIWKTMSIGFAAQTILVWLHFYLQWPICSLLQLIIQRLSTLICLWMICFDNKIILISSVIHRRMIKLISGSTAHIFYAFVEIHIYEYLTFQKSDC